MDLKAGTLLVPPAVKNSSCSHPRYSSGSHNFLAHIGLAETIEAFLILILTLGVIGANALVIFVINNRRYSTHIHQQPRYLLTSLALNDLAIGLLITPFGLIPALFHCWPYGEIFCQIQGLLRGALSQQSAVILVCMAVDRYMCALHPAKYHQHSSKKGCVAILSITWIISLTVFGFLVLPKGYYFNNTGLMACEPFYYKPSYRILATCALYFPTTMVLMYCYGSSFHMSRFRLNDLPPTNHHHHHQSLQTTPGGISIQSTVPVLLAATTTTANTITKKAVPIQEERHSNGSTSRSMAAISLGFIVMVTPWTIQEIVTACTGSKLPAFLDFLVTWTALSNSFWNPFLYWLLNSHFRRLSRHLLSNRWCTYVDSPEHKSHCCSISADCDATSLPLPPGPPTSRPPSSLDINQTNSFLHHPHHYRQSHHQQQQQQQRHHHHHQRHQISTRPDIEGLSEKYWGEILERTVSSNSLHALQKSFCPSTTVGTTTQHLHHQHHHHYLHHPTPSALNFHNNSGGGGSSSSKASNINLKICENGEHHVHIATTNIDNDVENENDDDDDDDEDDNDVGGGGGSNGVVADENDNNHNNNGDNNDDGDGVGGGGASHDDNNFMVDEPEILTTIKKKKIINSGNGNTIEHQQTKLCEHIYHDVNCAKTKAAVAAAAAAAAAASTSTRGASGSGGGGGGIFNGCHSDIRNLPDI